MHFEDLSPRQREILPLLAEGMDNFEIADCLRMKPQTVARHVEKIIDRIGAGSRMRAVAMAAREMARG